LLKSQEGIKTAYEQYLCNYNCKGEGNEELTWSLQVEDDGDEGVRLKIQNLVIIIIIIIMFFNNETTILNS
jgi:hypothetical protein